MHDQAVRSRIDHYAQRTTTVLGIHGQRFGQALNTRTAYLRVLDQVLDPVQMTLVDHRHHIRVTGHCRVEIAIDTAKRVEKRFKLSRGHVDQIRVDADLPTIANLARRDAEGRFVQVSRTRNDHRRLAAEFQGHRHQVFCSIAHH
ncbi:hypothetical protein D3C72_1968710 [compost metagenome]